CWGKGSSGRLGYGNMTSIGDDETPQSVGNIPGIDVGEPVSEPAIVYDEQDRLTKFGTKTSTYNANGEIASETDSATSTTRTFTYDVFVNLKQVGTPSKTVNYKVDGFNRRTVKQNGTAPDLYYIWNYSNQLIGIADDQGVLSAKFDYGSKTHVPDYMVK